jgi:hypothetical protein
MAYDLSPNNKALKPFRLGSLPHLLEQCGSYFTCISRNARWYTLWDERMSRHYHENDDGERAWVTSKQYPAIICQCGGFEVTAEEARVMARIARNYAAIQRTLDEPTEEEKILPIDTPAYKYPFPRWMRRDWVEQFEAFAEWAEQSEGFRIY